MKLARTNSEGTVEIIVPVNVSKTLSQFPDAIEIFSAPMRSVFRAAWEIDGNTIVENLVKSKEIAHTLRRQRRERLFEPLDSIIAKQIPGIDIVEIEAQRQNIRDNDTIVQAAIDTASTTDDLYLALSNYNAVLEI